MNIAIEKIEVVSFGKLKRVTVSPSDGINILSAPNESGKSTLAAFIKFVFYGFVGGGKKTLSENERKLFTPWDNEVCEGTVTITADGVKYDISRRCLPSGKESAEIINRATGKPEFKGEVPGEVFFGVGEDVFARTLFFRQLSLPQNKDEVLAERLRNIAIGADEEVSTEKALRRLNDAKKEIKTRVGGGILPKMEQERDRLEQLITDSTDDRREVLRLQTDIAARASRIETGEERLVNLEAERKNIEKYEAYQKLQIITRLTGEEAEAYAEYESASSSLCFDKSVSLPLLASQNTEYVVAQQNLPLLKAKLNSAQEELERAEAGVSAAISEEQKKSRGWILPAAASALLAVLGVVLCFTLGTIPMLVCLGLAVVLGIASVVSCVKSRKNANLTNYKSNVYQQKLQSLKERVTLCESECEQCRIHVQELGESLFNTLSKLGEVAKSNDYSARIEELRTLAFELEKKELIWKTKRSELDNALQNVDYDALSALAEGATSPARDRATVDRELKFYGQQQDLLIEQSRRDEVSLAALESRLGDVATLVGKRNALDARIAELTVKHKAYEAAMSFIDEAADSIKSTVAPRIGKRASEYFAAATGGKYMDIDLDTSLSMCVGSDFRRSCEYLSAGTRDSAYLSLRLALADMLFGGCGVPMLLDDAFVRMDDGRLRLMLGALSEAAKKHQIIILTHGTREKDALAATGTAFNEISIKSE